MPTRRGGKPTRNKQRPPFIREPTLCKKCREIRTIKTCILFVYGVYCE
nr:MAG TPA: hypothetical protein [Caudoviricetes sp.]